MAANRQRIFASALTHHQAGRPVEADAACGTLLAHWPDDADALNLRAVIACMAGRHADGIALLERLLARRPDNVQALSTLGDALDALGDSPGTIASFERAVALAPHDAGLRSRLGTALLDAGHFAEAEAAYRQSIALAGQVAQSHFNHAVALCRLDRTTEAVAAYCNAIALDPHHVAAHLNLGNVLMDQDRLDDAITLYQAAVALRPGAPEGHANLGLALLRQNRPDEAAASQCKAIACDADYAAAHGSLGAALREQGKPQEAIRACERAIVLKPDLAEAHITLGAAWLDLAQPEAAVAAFSRALELTPGDARIHSNLGVALIRLDRIDEAADACRAAIALNPLHAPAHTNLGVALQMQDRLPEAIAAHRLAIALDPGHGKAYSNLAGCLKDEGRLDAAFEASSKAVSLACCDDMQRFNHALALLMQGDYEAGWSAYEVRRKAGVLTPRERVFPVPEWRGETLKGRTLLLHAEQGFGDTLQFARFVRGLLEPGVAIVIECQRPLVSLLQSIGKVRVVAQGDPLPPFDLHLPLMSLPHVQGILLDTIPTTVPYLASNPEQVARWKADIGRTADLAVGVVWSGNPGHKSDRRRSIAAADVLPALVMPGVRLFSLQKDVRPEDTATLHTLAADITDLAPSLDDFADTAAALAALDLVIAVDTSTAHLAGALGRPVWVMLPFALDWRWLRDREDSPWYPTMRLFRQFTPRVWSDVLERIRAELSRAAQGERHCPGVPATQQTRMAGTRARP